MFIAALFIFTAIHTEALCSKVLQSVKTDKIEEIRKKSFTLVR